MVPYNDFQLTEKQIDLVKRLHQRRAIRQYIKENGVEPDMAQVQSWYTYTEKELEAHRLAYYSSFLARECQEQDVPNADNESYFICVMKGFWTEEEAEYYNEHYQGLAGVSYEFIKLSYDEENCYYFAKDIDTTQYLRGTKVPYGGYEYGTDDVLDFIITKGCGLGLTALKFGDGTTTETIIDANGVPRTISYGTSYVVKRQPIVEFRMRFYTSNAEHVQYVPDCGSAEYVKFITDYADKHYERDYLLR